MSSSCCVPSQAKVFTPSLPQNLIFFFLISWCFELSLSHSLLCCCCSVDENVSRKFYSTVVRAASSRDTQLWWYFRRDCMRLWVEHSVNSQWLNVHEDRESLAPWITNGPLRSCKMMMVWRESAKLRLLHGRRRWRMKASHKKKLFFIFFSLCLSTFSFSFSSEIVTEQSEVGKYSKLVWSPLAPSSSSYNVGII